jgi:hypothetical protein
LVALPRALEPADHIGIEAERDLLLGKRIRNSALSQKPGGITPASGSAAARRSTSSSLMSRNALLKGFGGGMSSRLLYLTMRPRFLVALAVISVCLRGRDDPDLAVSFSEYDPDHFKDEPSATISISRLQLR